MIATPSKFRSGIVERALIRRSIPWNGLVLLCKPSRLCRFHNPPRLTRKARGH